MVTTFDLNTSDIIWEPPTNDWSTGKPTRTQPVEIVIAVKVERRTRNRGTYTYFHITLKVEEVLPPYNHVKAEWDTFLRHLTLIDALRAVLMRKPFCLNAYSTPKDRFKVGSVAYDAPSKSELKGAVGELFIEQIEEWEQEYKGLKGKVIEMNLPPRR